MSLLKFIATRLLLLAALAGTWLLAFAMYVLN